MRSRGERGFTLIEVLIALIVLVLGVLGAAAMTLGALRDNKQSGLRSQASALAYEIADLMRMSGPSEVTVFTTGAPTATSACWTGGGCTVTQTAANNYYEWQQKLAATLPNGQAKICQDTSLNSNAADYAICGATASAPYVVKLSWDEKSNNARDAATPVAVTTAYLVVPIQPY